MDGVLESVFGMIWSYLFEVVSLLIAAAALVYAALALRVAKHALETAKESDLAALKLKAHEGRASAERSFLSLQSACQDARSRWDIHLSRHFPKLGAQDYRREDTRHISEVENEGRKLLIPLTLELSQLGTMDARALEEYIERTNQTVLWIAKLCLRLRAPKQLSA